MGSAKIYRSAAGESAVKDKYNDWLRHWPVEKEKLQLDTRHGQTHVIASGNPQNPPLLLFHGAGTSALVWLKDIQTYAKSHRVYAVDIIGEAGHSEAQRPPLKSRAYAEWIEDLMNALQIDRAALAGIGFGAWCCLQFAGTQPERVTRLALLCPAGVVSLRKRYRLKALLMTLLLGPWGRRLLRRRIVKKNNLEQWLAEYLQLTTRHFKYRFGNPPPINNKLLSQLYCPVLLVVGGRDAYYDVDKVVLRLAKQAPLLEVDYRQREGHMVWDFARPLDRFLLTQYAPD